MYRCYFVFRLDILMCNILGNGSGSPVGRATEYGLDDPGSNPGGDDSPVLGPTQPPVKWVPGLSRG